MFQLTHARGRDWDLYRRGILLLKDIPDGERLTAAQRRQVDGAKLGTHTVDRPALGRWLSELRYPLHHLDFETIMPAVPLFDGTRPFQQLPFQYSLHVQAARGATPEHREFLADGCGVVVAYPDVDALGGALVDLFVDPGAREAMVARAAERVREGHDLPVAAPRLHAELLSVLAA